MDVNDYSEKRAAPEALQEVSKRLRREAAERLYPHILSCLNYSGRKVSEKDLHNFLSDKKRFESASRDLGELLKRLDIDDKRSSTGRVSGEEDLNWIGTASVFYPVKGKAERPSWMEKEREIDLTNGYFGKETPKYWLVGILETLHPGVLENKSLFPHLEKYLIRNNRFLNGAPVRIYLGEKNEDVEEAIKLTKDESGRLRYFIRALEISGKARRGAIRREMAERMRVSPSTVHNKLEGFAPIGQDEAQEIADIMDYPEELRDIFEKMGARYI
jgi:hypothetical protein